MGPESGGTLAASGAASMPSAQAQVNQRLASTGAFTGVVAVLPVKDHAASVAWYARWLGRNPDVVPMEGVAEWNLAQAGWLQVALDPVNAGRTSVVVTVHDANAQRLVCSKAGLNPGDVQDLGVVKLVELKDPDGNNVVFVQEVQAPAGSSQK